MTTQSSMSYKAAKSLIGDFVQDARKISNDGKFDAYVFRFGELLTRKELNARWKYESGLRGDKAINDHIIRTNALFPCAIGDGVKPQHKDICAVISFDDGRGGEFPIYRSATPFSVVMLASKVCKHDFDIDAYIK